MNIKIFKKDFILVVIGQIISLFGNTVLRFALPLYLLNQTGSAAIFGVISAIAFIPMLILCPIGGIIADRVNKRNIMVILDFTTAGIVTLMCVFMGKVDIILLILVVMILLYGIQGAYQPAVQASLPALLSQDDLMSGNAIINLVQSLSSLIGPVIGGAVYSFFGLMPILYISAICFLISAIMEIFIVIPFHKQSSEGSIFRIGFGDMKKSFHFIRKDQPSIWKVSLLIAAINMFMSSLIMIGLPIIITQYLPFDTATASSFYGYAEGAIAAGSLIGGISAGVLSKKLKIKYSPLILLLCSLTVFPIAIVLHIAPSAMLTYIVILVSCVVMMICANLFSIQMMACLQILTPPDLIGKVISCAMCIGMCATPLGQALYGTVFQICMTNIYLPFYVAGVISIILTLISRPLFKKIAPLIDK